MRVEEKQQLGSVLRAECANLQATIEMHAGVVAKGEAGAAAVPVDAALVARAKADLQRVEQNLAELGQAEFGLCEQCDQPIPLQRLLLLPAARLCVVCAGRSERGG